MAPQKCLILYASRTGNTEKIALVFKKVFERSGWKCDLFKVDQKTDVTKLPFEYDDYDFMCVGSPVHDSLALEEVILALRRAPKEESKRGIPHEKIVFGSKKGIVFATYAGAHLGPKEAVAALAWMDLEMEHQKFQCIGSFCCPGKFINEATPTWYHGDIRNRPNERDFKKAELFIEDKLEEIAERHS
jgi:hypothetical protein